ncbi:hypothetical protein HN51_024049 [Arachis hypogaea]|uniref:HMA domain-containing protein n=1 Tax=Arachis hypogaea TaxID=3818 RepID=A0A445C4K4_ARAHY|nr:heavy metal-associated isoprenylated plant protein 3 [Arachis hypogaea]QHO27040.1 hypothetical protein DS421_7g204510 [Arachis hypogaea]RYR45811.1 hypothetical protein Ahy_A07g031596 [Arachis hypogaea]
MGEEKKKSEGGENNVVLKVDCSCDGCATKIRRCLRSFPGVENVKAESDTGKITVTGKVSDPAKMKEKLEEKLNKKVLLISPQIKKDKNNKNGDHNNKENKSDGDNKEKKSKEKEKETPVMTTAVLKVALHCQGCVDKIRKTVSKTKGVNEMEINKEKDTVTVQGTMDVKALAANLTEKLKRKVEVVPPKKPDNKENNGGGGDGKKNKGGGGGGNNNNEEMVMMEQNRMEYMAAPHVLFPSAYGYGYAPVMHPHHPGGYSYMPGYTYPEQFHLHAPPPPPQIFSDENPHACSLM